MRWFTLPGWPARVLGHSAAMPVPARPPGSAVHYKGDTYGYPGTQAIPVYPKSGPTVPGGGADTPAPAVAQMGVSRSGDAPNAFYPNLYWARPEPFYKPGAGMPISVFSDNLMPVPATDPRGVPAPMAVPLSMRGVHQIRQPATLIQWPGVTG